MRKRITLLTVVAALLLMINCGLISVDASNLGDYETATLITEADLSNGVPFDKPYKMIPTRDVVIEITTYSYHVSVLERGENDTWASIRCCYSRDEDTLFSLKSGKEYWFRLDSYSSQQGELIKEAEAEVVETPLDANGVDFDKPFNKMTPTKDTVVAMRINSSNDVSVLERGENYTWSGANCCYVGGDDYLFWLESGKEYWFIICFHSWPAHELIKEVEVLEPPLDANGIQFDQPYKMTPTKDIKIAITWTNVLEVLERGENGRFTSVKDDFYSGDFSFYSLKANTDYVFCMSSYRSGVIIKEVEYTELTLDGNGGHFGDSDKEYVTRVKGTDLGPALKEPERDGYVFYDYNTKPDGSGMSIKLYDSFTKDITFYAIWKKLYTVDVYANGGRFRSLKVNPDTDDYDYVDHVTCTVAEKTPGNSDAYLDFDYVIYEERISPIGYRCIPEREGFNVKGWNTKADGSGKYYESGVDAGPFSTDETLYAIWVCEEDKHNYGEWRTTKEPTAYSKGQKERSCSVCGAIETQSIDTLSPEEARKEQEIANAEAAIEASKKVDASYPAESKAAVDAAIRALENKMADNNATVAEIKEATRVLNDAVTAAENAKAESEAKAKAKALAAASNINKATVSASDIRKASDLGAKEITLGAKVKKIKSGAFKGTNIKTVVVKSKKLKAKAVKGSLKGSKVKTIKIKVGKTKDNKKYIKIYKKIFTKKNAGKKVAVK